MILRWTVSTDQIYLTDFLDLEFVARRSVVCAQFLRFLWDVLKILGQVS